eukprot:XP_001707532.1 Hypothetical protein GL50803_103771 [Giardia lamblia ATCC 50803]
MCLLATHVVPTVEKLTIDIRKLNAVHVYDCYRGIASGGLDNQLRNLAPNPAAPDDAQIHLSHLHSYLIRDC